MCGSRGFRFADGLPGAALIRWPVMDELTRLAQAARAGRRDALDAFVGACYPDVWRMCAGLVDEQAAHDLAQESCLRAARSLNRFRGEASARTWILAITRRVCIDELRARERQRRRDNRLTITQHAETAPDPSGNLIARDMLRQLDPDRRAAFILTQIFRLSYDEAAKVCECPPGTIRSRVARARDELITTIQDHEDHGQQADRPRANG